MSDGSINGAESLIWSALRSSSTFKSATSKVSPRMSEDAFNMSIRKFLKEVGVTSQREIEAVVRDRPVTGTTLRVRMVLTADGTNLHHEVEGEIELP
jgi:hypothetical protein